MCGGHNEKLRTSSRKAQVSEHWRPTLFSQWRGGWSAGFPCATFGDGGGVGFEAGAIWLKPVRTCVGWLVARVGKLTPSEVLPFEEVRERVKAMLLGQRRHEEEIRLREALWEDARIEDLVVF